MRYEKKSIREGVSKYLKDHQHTRGIIVSESRNFIYMKPAKTAGTTILRKIFESKIPDIIHQKDNPKKFQKWMCTLSDDKLKNYFVFSVTRNPWDRVVSICSHFNIKVKNFVKNFDNIRQNNEDIKNHSIPVNRYTHVNGKRFADFICRFETLQSDMNVIMDKIGLQRVKLPVTNKSSRGEYQNYFSDSLAKETSRIYSKDIHHFGYMFGRDKREYGIIERMTGKISKVIK